MRVIILMRMGCGMGGDGETHTGFWWRNQKERDRYEDLRAEQYFSSWSPWRTTVNAQTETDK